MTDDTRGKNAYVMTPLAAAVVAALSPTDTVVAQEEEESSRALDEITVTATRRAVNLQDVAQIVSHPVLQVSTSSLVTLQVFLHIGVGKIGDFCVHSGERV